MSEWVASVLCCASFVVSVSSATVPVMVDINGLKRLPIPPLKDTLQRYLARLEPLQDDKQNGRAKQIVMSDENLAIMEKLQQQLIEYDQEQSLSNPQTSYIEQFWYDAYLLHDQSVVMNINPFFQLEDDPTINYSTFDQNAYGKHTLQIKRSSKLILSTLKFIKQIRHGTLTSDSIRGKIPLSMDQYDKLFGSSRIPPGPGEDSCHLQTDHTSHHIIIMHKSQFYWFDVLDVNNMPIFKTLEELEWNLFSIIMDCANEEQEEPTATEIVRPFGVFTTENRRVWSNVRDYIFNDEDTTNWKNLKIIDSALFVVCLDDLSFPTANYSEAIRSSELVQNMLCGTSKIDLDDDHSTSSTGLLGLQKGTCLNRWYDKLQLIITKDANAGINFEHTGVDGHTVLRLASDIYTDSILSFATGITKNAPQLFDDPSLEGVTQPGNPNLITIPRKLEWKIDSFLSSSLHFAETRLSDLISQYEFATLDFKHYGASRIKSKFHCSPDAFTQQIFQIAYYALYGKFEATYEPAMTKMFQNGRTEAIRSVTHSSKRFVKSLFDRDTTDEERIIYLHEACKEHGEITKECSIGLGQDRHLYALYCVWKEWFQQEMPTPPPLFDSKSWQLFNTNILSTSNCGNPSLKNFGFGPVTANGFGIGYVIREESISIVVSSRHRQTKRFVALMEKSLLEIDHIFTKQQAETGPNTDTRARNEQHPVPYLADLHPQRQKKDQSKSKDMKFLLGGYDYFDVSVSG